ncbi:MAG: hypothetical protein IKT78_01520, partial [Ruminiclostridium sp.]|nr:hypothetical protein [Ruminiclostridium sp.]
PEIIAYMQSLHEMGVKYIEMTPEIFLRLPPGYDFSKVILRVADKNDVSFVNSFNFAYVLLPANLTGIASEIRHPIISEIYLRGSNALAVTKMFKRSFDLSNVAMIRYVDDFADDDEAMERLIDGLHGKFIWPIDICPLNKKGTALSSVFAAISARADSVTLRYGNKVKYGELQDFILNRSNIYGVIPSQEAVLALCRCNALYPLVFGEPSNSETDALRKYQIIPHRSVPVDGILSYGYESKMLKSIRKTKPVDDSYMSPLVEKLRNMQLDSKSAKELCDIIDSYSAKFFK